MASAAQGHEIAHVIHVHRTDAALPREMLRLDVVSLEIARRSTHTLAGHMHSGVVARGPVEILPA